MWNQWGTMPAMSATMPPMPTTAVPIQPAAPPLPSLPPPPQPAGNPTTQPVAAPLSFIGPVMPNSTASPSVGSVVNPDVSVDQSNPYSQYTAAQYAAMTPEQQYALQQHWQQWQAYQQEYAKWHAQYGEQYKREMAAAVATSGISGATSYPGYFQQQQQQQPALHQPPLHQPPLHQPPLHQPSIHQPPHHQPPLPPPTTQENTIQRQNKVTGKISGQPQMYNKPPPPLPQTGPTFVQQQQWQHPLPNLNINFNQPPPNFNMNRTSQVPMEPNIYMQQPPPIIKMTTQKNTELIASSNQQEKETVRKQQFNNEYSFEGNKQQPENLYTEQNLKTFDSKEFGDERIYEDSNSKSRDSGFTLNNRHGESYKSNYNEEHFKRKENNSESVNDWNKNENAANNKFDENGSNNFYRNDSNNLGPNWDNHKRNNFSNSNIRNNWNNYNDGRNLGVKDYQNSFKDCSSYKNNDDKFHKSWFNSNNDCASQWNSNANDSFNNFDQKNHSMSGSNSANFGTPSNQDDWSKQQKLNNNNMNQTQKVPDLDEESFDRIFRQWEEQFENWKLANTDNPDREMYLHIENEFEKQRRRIIERRDQMRKRKMERAGLCDKNVSFNANTQITPPEEIRKVEIADTKKTNKIEKNDDIIENLKTSQSFDKSEGKEEKEDNKLKADVGTYEKKDISIVMDTQEEKSLSLNPKKSTLGKRKSRFNSPTITACKTDEVNNEVISLDDDSDEELNKSSTNEEKNKNISEIFHTSGGIPGLDLVDNSDVKKRTDVIVEKEDNFHKEENESMGPTRPPKVAAISNTTNKKIPSLFDIVIENPNKSPEQPNDKIPEVQDAANTEDPNSVLNPNIANSLKDPNFLQNVSKALAHIQAIPNPALNLVRNPEILEKLPALLQIVQQQNNLDKNNRSFESSFNDNTGDAGMGGSNVRVNNAANFRADTFQPNLTVDGSGSSFRNNRDDRNFNPNFRGNSNYGSSEQKFGNDRVNRNDRYYGNNDRNAARNERNYGRNEYRDNNDRNFPIRERIMDNGNNNNLNQLRNDQNRMNENRRNNFGSYRGNGNNNQRYNDSNDNQRTHQSESKNTDNCFEAKSDIAEPKSSNAHNPFRKSGAAIPIFDEGVKHQSGQKNDGHNPWSNNSGNDAYFVSNMRVFDYQNSGTVPPKVIDYGHKPVASSDDDYKPVKTIDYGHASKVKNKNNKIQNKFNQNMNIFGNQSKDETLNQNNLADFKENTSRNVNENKQITEDNSLKIDKIKNSNLVATETVEGGDAIGIIDNKAKESVKNLTNADKDLEEISDTEEDVLQDNSFECLESPPPPPPMYSSDKPLICEQISKNESPISIFPSTAKANENIIQKSTKHVQMSITTVENQNTITIDEILLHPGRLTRPKKICIILRGPPGSGKSYVAKILKEKEIETGNSDVRILSIDDYFIVENDYEDVCPKTGKKIPKKELLYEYDKEMEETYLQYLIKAFKKTISDNLYDFIIIDCNNNSLRSLNEFYCYSKDSGYMPYIVDLLCDVKTCLKNNIHDRTETDILEIITGWNATPLHYIKLDISPLIENTIELENPEEMVMENVSDIESSEEITDLTDSKTENIEDLNEESNDTNDPTMSCGFLKSKWENDTTSENLARLDGITKSLAKRKAASMEDYLQLDEWQPTTRSNDQKRVRWADIEERRQQDKMRAIGFVVGQTDWKRMMDPNAGNRALNKTKYIERVNKRRF